MGLFAKIRRRFSTPEIPVHVHTPGDNDCVDDACRRARWDNKDRLRAEAQERTAILEELKPAEEVVRIARAEARLDRRRLHELELQLEMCRRHGDA